MVLVANRLKAVCRTLLSRTNSKWERTLTPSPVNFTPCFQIWLHLEAKCSVLSASVVCAQFCMQVAELLRFQAMIIKSIKLVSASETKAERESAQSKKCIHSQSTWNVRINYRIGWFILKMDEKKIILRTDGQKEVRECVTMVNWT